MTDDKQVTKITLNANNVKNPLFKELEKCSNFILFGLQTAELVNEIPPNLEIKEGFFRFQVGKNSQDIEIKKKQYKNWLVKKGFEDLVKGIEYSLREAFLYVSILSRFSELKTGEDFNQAFAEIRKRALRMHIPNMIEKIEPLLIK